MIRIGNNINPYTINRKNLSFESENDFIQGVNRGWITYNNSTQPETGLSREDLTKIKDRAISSFKPPQDDTRIGVIAGINMAIKGQEIDEATLSGYYREINTVDNHITNVVDFRLKG